MPRLSHCGDQAFQRQNFPLQELAAAAKRKADEEKPVIKDEPLEAPRPKRAKAPSTPILPPGAAKRIADSAAASASRGPAMPSKPPEAARDFPAVSSEAAQQSNPGKQPAAPSDKKPPVSAEAVLNEGCSTAHLWPSQNAAVGPSGDTNTENGAEEPQQLKKTATEQAIEVEEVEWRPGQLSGSPPGRSEQRAAPAQAQERLTPEAPAADVGCASPLHHARIEARIDDCTATISVALQLMITGGSGHKSPRLFGDHFDEFGYLLARLCTSSFQMRPHSSSSLRV